MAITFIKEKKKQQYLIFVLIGLTGLIAVYFVFLKRPRVSPILLVPLPEPRKIEINFEVLEDPIFEEFQVPEEIPPLKETEELGRENPFDPYGKEEEEISEE